MRSVKAKNSADLRAKLFRYAASQGYDFSTAKRCVEQIVKDEEEW
jgi:SOS response regulatory protein OraA/RecX